MIARPPAIDVPAAVQTERAAAELREARPIVVSAAGGGALVFAGEHVTANRLAALREFGSPALLLSPRRAETLRLPQYTPEAVALTIEPDWSAAYILALIDPARDMDYALHGPLKALRGGLDETARAAMRLALQAGLLPAAILVALSDTALELAVRAGFLGLEAAAALQPAVPGGPLSARLVASARLPLSPDIAAELIGFRVEGPDLWGTRADWAHYALAIGRPEIGRAPLVRIHSECFTGDFLGSLKCDCGVQLRGAVMRIAEERGGFLLYLRQEGRGIGLLNKLRAYHLQDQGLDTVEANERLGFADDQRSYAPAARMLEALGANRVRLLTNNPRKTEGLAAEGIEVIERVGHSFPANPHNAHYLATKRDRGGHLL